MKRLIFVLFSMFVCVGCMSSHTERVVDVNPQRWAVGECLELEFENDDTISLKDLDIILRVDNRFKNVSMPLRLSFLSPDNVIFSERFNLDLSSAKTKESGVAHKDYTVKYVSEADLTKKGIYKVKFEPTLTDFVGVWAIGIKIKY
ncbi:MAG: hypothetical protein R3Y38_01370 [Rikenellaceae bacterium]